MFQLAMMKKIQVINNGYDFDKIEFIDKSKNQIFKIGMLARWDLKKIMLT